MTFGISDGSRKFRKLLPSPEKFEFNTGMIVSIEWPNIVPRLRICDFYEIHILH